jgi:hypothetical protein
MSGISAKTEKRKNSRGRNPGMILQPRDRQLLEELSTMRVLDREQAKIVAGFHSTTRANARLLKLTQARLLRRFFLGTDGAGRKALYALSRKGAFVADVPYRSPQRRVDERVFADYFIEHQLTINEIYCSLKFGETFPEGVSFGRWLVFHEPLGAGCRLIPDGYVELVTPAGTLAGFLEIDLGHERGPVWKEKVRNYLQYALSGDCERQFGQNRFRVVVITTTERKLQSIRKLTAALTDKIFWFGSLPSIREQGFFTAQWLRPRGDDPVSFVTNHNISVERSL